MTPTIVFNNPVYWCINRIIKYLKILHFHAVTHHILRLHIIGLSLFVYQKKHWKRSNLRFTYFTTQINAQRAYHRIAYLYTEKPVALTPLAYEFLFLCSLQNERRCLQLFPHYSDIFKLLAPELFFILAHPVYKMWIIQEPNTL